MKTVSLLKKLHIAFWIYHLTLKYPTWKIHLQTREQTFDEILNTFVENQESNIEENSVDRDEGNVRFKHNDTGYILFMHRNSHFSNSSGNLSLTVFKTIGTAFLIFIY